MNDDEHVPVKWQLLGISNLPSKPQVYAVIAKTKKFLGRYQNFPKEKGRLVVTQQMGMSRLSKTEFIRRRGSPDSPANVVSKVSELMEENKKSSMCHLYDQMATYRMIQDK